MRRLPVFFLLDCSESMIGGNLEKLKKGIQKIVTDLRRDPHALETVYISVIAFAGKAKTIVPLIDLISFYPPMLPIGGGTSLGAALRELRQQMETTLKKTTSESKGDWKPIVYLITDGRPTDKVHEEIKIWQEQYANKANFIAISLGHSADMSILHQLTETVILFNDNSQDDFAQFIKWITSSVSAHSQNINQDITSINSYSNVLSFSDAKASQYYDENCVVLVGKCSNVRQPYLIKYTLANNVTDLNHQHKYKLDGCYPVDNEYFDWSDNKNTALLVNTNQLIGAPGCPHCGNNIAFAVCNCGNLLCIDHTGDAICPWCEQQLQFNMDSPDEDFDVIRGKG
ncbi:VWA domain-containing protein [Frischella sp. Ac48]|uniref:VWA domain-containing protein n=1 Tax=Frischella japonica TaxID=2741544 RepID=A0ABR7QUU7_9GAMM|nr:MULTISPECIES: TerY-C metal binding domain-containing protein [Frischella]MBC9129979.1 VWA domain-containing protein [Frischella japonica]MBX4132963.1 VWA domain-containing protein [Frischella sp. Ac48]